MVPSLRLVVVVPLRRSFVLALPVPLCHAPAVLLRAPPVLLLRRRLVVVWEMLPLEGMPLRIHSFKYVLVMTPDP